MALNHRVFHGVISDPQMCYHPFAYIMLFGPKKNIPIASMGLVYLPTFPIQIDQMWVNIPVPWMVWGSSYHIAQKFCVPHGLRCHSPVSASWSRWLPSRLWNVPPEARATKVAVAVFVVTGCVWLGWAKKEILFSEAICIMFTSKITSFLKLTI